MSGALHKTVAKDDLYLFKSCQSGSWYPGIERSLRYILNRLGVNYVDDPGQSSCTGCGYHMGVIPLLTNLTLNARNLSRASVSGRDNLICTCPTCYENLRECRDLLDSEGPLRDRALAILEDCGLHYRPPSSIDHVSETLLEMSGRLLEISRHRMEGVRFVAHHGCHYYKIFRGEVHSGDSEVPTVLDELGKRFGGIPLDYPERYLCCGAGFHHTLCSTDYPLEVMRRKYSGLLEVRPELMITQCAGCTLNLDLYQESVLEELGIQIEVPVLHAAELVALLMGAHPYRIVGIDMHAVPIEPLMRKLGVMEGI
ncbi:MAG: heterodisulfide reductase-related iron-sulfur binding cluster [Methanomassiliicoccales archaeon]